MNHSTAPDPHPLTRDDDTIDAHYSGLERLEALEILKAPHGCMNGYVYIGHMIEEGGEDVEVVEAVPCRRCADSRGGNQ
jgi:hypothetical protein